MQDVRIYVSVKEARYTLKIVRYFYKGDSIYRTSLKNLFLSIFLYKSRLKGVYFKRKEFAPRGSKFFPFKVYPFSEESQNSFERVFSLELN